MLSKHNTKSDTVSPGQKVAKASDPNQLVVHLQDGTPKTRSMNAGNILKAQTEIEPPVFRLFLDVDDTPASCERAVESCID